VFGSVATGQTHANSDIDLLVDLEPGRTLFDVAALHDELVELLGYEVDVLTSGAVRGTLSRVADEAVPL
jgi:predicted nucleotidyltransferase